MLEGLEFPESIVFCIEMERTEETLYETLENLAYWLSCGIAAFCHLPDDYGP